MKYDDSQSIVEHNKILFDKFRKLKFPINEYVIVSGGPLAIRNLKKTGDVDVLVSDKLWENLSERFPVVEHPEMGLGIIKIADDIDVLHFEKEAQIGPTQASQLKQAEIIEGLSFQSLEHCLWFKEHSDREKDRKDAVLIKEWIISNENK